MKASNWDDWIYHSRPPKRKDREAFDRSFRKWCQRRGLCDTWDRSIAFGKKTPNTTL